MAYDIGTARGVIELEYNGSGIDQATEDLDNLGEQGEKAAGRTEKALNSTANASLAAGAAIAGGLALGINAAANFEQRMSAVAAVSGASAQELDQLSDKALQLGKDTQFSATEAASAIEELVKAGIPIADVLNGAADATVALAAAGEVALPEAATIASNAMNQFSLKAKDLPNVADKIAGAANASAIDVADFGQSLQQVGAVANLAGVNFDDVASAIALMGNAGIKGSDAGTSLKSMFARLIPQTKEQVDEMSRLGILTFDANTAMDVLRKNGIKPAGKDFDTLNGQLNQLAASLTNSKAGSAKAAKEQERLMLQTGALSSAFYDEQGNLKSLDQVSQILKTSLKGMTAEQKQATLQTLFGSDAIRAAAILTKNGAKGFDKMGESIGKVKAADVAKTRMDNLKGSIEAMKGSLETAGIVIGQALLPPLRTMVDALSAAFNWFLNLSDGQQKFITITLAVVAALLLVVGGVIKFVLMIGRLQATLVALRAIAVPAWAATLGPILLIVAAIAVLIGIFVILYKKNETFKKIVDKVWGAIKIAVMAVVDWFKTLPGFFKKLWKMIEGPLKAIGQFFADTFNMIKSVVMAVWGFIGPFIIGYMKIIWTVISTYIKLIIAIWKLAWAVIRLTVAVVWLAIRTYIAVALGIITALFKAMVAIWKPIFTGAWNAIKTAASIGWNLIKGVITPVLDAISTAFGVLTDLLSTGWDFLSGLATTIGGYLAPLQTVFETVFGAMGSVVQTVIDLINSIKDAVNDAVGWLGKLNPANVDLTPGFDVPGVPFLRMAANGSGAPGMAAAGSGMPTVTGGSAGLGASSATATGGLRLLDGTLSIDESGRAYISGVATDAVDDAQDFDAFLGRM